MSSPDPIEPQMPRTEMKGAGLTVAITIAVALVLAVIGGYTDGGVRVGFVLAAPVVVILGAVFAGIATYRSYVAGGRWPVWQGGMWFLMMVFLVWIMGAFPAVWGD